MVSKNKYRIIKECTQHKLDINGDLIISNDSLFITYDIQYMETLIIYAEKVTKEVYEIQD